MKVLELFVIRNFLSNQTNIQLDQKNINTMILFNGWIKVYECFIEHNQVVALNNLCAKHVQHKDYCVSVASDTAFDFVCFHVQAP